MKNLSSSSSVSPAPSQRLADFRASSSFSMLAAGEGALRGALSEAPRRDACFGCRARKCRVHVQPALSGYKGLCGKVCAIWRLRRHLPVPTDGASNGHPSATRRPAMHAPFASAGSQNVNGSRLGTGCFNMARRAAGEGPRSDQR